MERHPQILIDEPEDGYIESSAWVEVTTEVTPEKAIELIERDWPTEDREEEERYIAEGTEWHKPDPNTGIAVCAVRGGVCDCGDRPCAYIPDDWDPWVPAEEGEPGALLFHVIKVVCAA